MNSRRENNEIEARKKKKIIVILVSLFVFCIFTVLIYFFQFSSLGYRMSVSYRNSFVKIEDNVYMNRNNSMNQEDIVKMVKSARERDCKFFGDLQSKPVIIVCDDQKLLSHLGGDHNTQTTTFPAIQSYISVSNEYCNVDILAHEMTHAELYSRMSADTLKVIPTWFDEGVALQNDYREEYGQDAWEKSTDNGKYTVAPEDMDDPSEFYAGTSDDRRFRYINAKHEVSEWLKEHRQEDFIELIQKLDSGVDFYTVYGKRNLP